MLLWTVHDRNASGWTALLRLPRPAAAASWRLQAGLRPGLLWVRSGLRYCIGIVWASKLVINLILLCRYLTIGPGVPWYSVKQGMWRLYLFIYDMVAGIVTPASHAPSPATPMFYGTQGWRGRGRGGAQLAGVTIHTTMSLEAVPARPGCISV